MKQKSSLGNMDKCAWNICVNPVGLRRRFCSLKCKRKYFVDKRRKNIKRMAMEYKGGVCQICGYSKCETALVFHHLDPARKNFALSMGGYTRAWKIVREELDKCVLLCSNCHAETHAGLNNKISLN